MDDERYWGMRPQVYLECAGKLSDMKLHGLQNIEEDELGRDVVTFLCAECGNIHKSRVFTI